MPTLNIKNPRAYELISELAELDGISMTAAVIEAAQEALDRKKLMQAAKKQQMIDKLEKILEPLKTMKRRTNLTADEIIGYNEHGFFD